VALKSYFCAEKTRFLKVRIFCFVYKQQSATLSFFNDAPCLVYWQKQIGMILQYY